VPNHGLARTAPAGNFRAGPRARSVAPNQPPPSLRPMAHRFRIRANAGRVFSAAPALGRQPALVWHRLCTSCASRALASHPAKGAGAQAGLRRGISICDSLRAHWVLGASDAWPHHNRGGDDAGELERRRPTAAACAGCDRAGIAIRPKPRTAHHRKSFPPLARQSFALPAPSNAGGHGVLDRGDCCWN
jgi:hypothetical protein